MVQRAKHAEGDRVAVLDRRIREPAVHEVHVAVDEPREDRRRAQVDPGAVLGRGHGLRHRGDAVAFDEYRAGPKLASRPIDERVARDERAHRAYSAPIARSRPSFFIAGLVTVKSTTPPTGRSE